MMKKIINYINISHIVLNKILYSCRATLGSYELVLFCLPHKLVQD